MSDTSPLRKFRKAQGMKLRELEAQTGISGSQLSRIEREGTTSLPTAMLLAEKTGLPVTAFARPDADAAA